MESLETIDAVRAWRAAASEAGDSVGLVPTMGALHSGHLALVAAARRDNQRTIASVFVNPAQFEREDDLGAYPRDLKRDRGLLEDAGCEAIFAPAPQTIYPLGFDTWVEPGSVAAEQEGRHRPGHFRGVATVVLKLLNIVQPTRAYFGQKDAQQLAVIRALVRDLDLPVEVQAVATVREADGLALSSRNVHLAADERRAAGALHRGLRAAEAAFAAGERRAEALAAAARRELDAEPLIRTEYVSVADPDTMRELASVETHALVSLAVRIGNTRLIDNLTLRGTALDNGPPSA